MNKTLEDALFSRIMIPVNDNWYPSYDRGYKDEPYHFEECDCWECLLIPKIERQKHAHWNWQEGGRVSCSMSIFDKPKYLSSKPEINDPQYMARVSFW